MLEGDCVDEGVTEVTQGSDGGAFGHGGPERIVVASGVEVLVLVQEREGFRDGGDGGER
ncbi:MULTISPECIES: hypothetical protein [Streptomyces]|uniref:Uncharacterized protein n=1 Tax=Streptomyces luteosporeus TaxID=173856 RepID=A0ABP6GF32_9ACTN